MQGNVTYLVIMDIPEMVTDYSKKKTVTLKPSDFFHDQVLLDISSTCLLGNHQVQMDEKLIRYFIRVWLSGTQCQTFAGNTSVLTFC